MMVCSTVSPPLWSRLHVLTQSDIDDAQRMNPTAFGGSLVFPVPPPAGQGCHGSLRMYPQCILTTFVTRFLWCDHEVYICGLE